MKKVFISHSYQDKEFVALLVMKLEEADIKAVTNYNEIAEGSNVAEKISSLIDNTDYVLVVFSVNGVKSKWVKFELSATIVNEISRNENVVIPIIIEDCDIPFDLSDRNFIDFRNDKTTNSVGFGELINYIKAPKLRDINNYKSINKSNDFKLQQLKNEYLVDNLTIFCGSGVSYDALVPTWNTLLSALFKAVYNNDNLLNIDKELIFILQKKIGVSPLIIGKYLKRLLDKDFISSIRDALYEKCTYESATIDAIVALCKARLKNIITFNFDDLIEYKLKLNGVKFKTVHTSGQRIDGNQVCVVHPHGYIPNNKAQINSNEIVFSEDGYHSQFIESFSWSNLIQLNHLDNKTCLFIGISLTDPNMRRLLDVSFRKYGGRPSADGNHFIIKKRHSIAEFYDEEDKIKIKDGQVIDILEQIEEQDANDLGFHVIWVKDYNEIPSILNKIGN